VAEKGRKVIVPPTVSICLPVRNAEPFLAERIASIREQTMEDWEVEALDGFSDDGSWEKLQDWAAREPRVRLDRREPEGIYPSINHCISNAKGAYVYIATADDMMPPECLEKLSEALDEHPDCGLAHCPPKIIGDLGQDLGAWWSRGSVFARSAPGLVGKYHMRRAPLDGLLHLDGDSVYVSLTQLLIRRSLFDSPAQR